MSIILTSDPDYRAAKLIKQGRSRLDPVYDDFVAGFRAQFGFEPLALFLDARRKPEGDGSTPRVGVALEYTDQYRSFEGRGRYDADKQRAIVDLLVETVGLDALRGMFGLPRRLFRAPLDPADIFVYFDDFQRVATQEIHDLVTDAELETFTAQLDLGDEFWCTTRLFSAPIVFVFTDEQADAIRSTERPKRWADVYFELAKQHDEFGYLRREQVGILVDSKENFDTNFASNWYYYFK